MTTRIEEELTVGLREHAADLQLGRDVLAAARRRHRRRTVVTRAASATATLGVAGAVAAAIALNGPPGAPGGADVRLDAATVAARISQALTGTETQVLHVTSRSSGEATSKAVEVWADPVSGRLVESWSGGGRRYDVARDTRGDSREIVTVHHDNRTWSRAVGGRTPLDLIVVTALVPPEDLRAALRRGTVRIAGKDQVDGRTTLHLVLTTPLPEGERELWVDARTYVPVRIVTVFPGHRYQSDYEYLPRTAEALAHVTLTPPAGYRRVRP